MPGNLIPSVILGGAADRIRMAGRDPLAIARRTGIAPAALEDPDLLVPASGVIRYFEIAAATCRNRNWGLELSLRASLGAVIGPLWILARNARSVRQMCEDLAANFDLYSTAALMRFEPMRGGGRLNWSAATGQVDSEVQMAEFALSVFLAELRRHAAPDWTPPGVVFRHGAPDDLRLHRRVFGPHVRFDGDRHAIELDAATLARPLQGSAPHARGLIRDVLRLDEDAHDLGASLQAQALVRTLLPFAPCTVRDVGSAMGISPRLLQLRLQREGTSFKAIKDAVRADLAGKYLQHSRMSATQIAGVLGYTDATSFSRSFRRWNGKTVRAQRRAMREGSAADPDERPALTPEAAAGS